MTTQGDVIVNTNTSNKKTSRSSIPSSKKAATAAAATTINEKSLLLSSSSSNNNNNNNTSTVIAVDPVGARKKKKKDRTTSITSNSTTSISNKGKHPKKLRLNESTPLEYSTTTAPPESSASSSLPATHHHHHHHRHHHPKDTATADGHMMYEMLNTFSTNEYQTFVSYQRSNFSSSVIENYIAACLDYHHHHHRNNASSTPVTTMNSETTRLNKSSSSKLEDYVSTPTQASDIGLIVATAAKIYAQRLIAEAVYLQKKDQRRHTSHQNNHNHQGTDINNDNTITATPTTTVMMDIESSTYHPNVTETESTLITTATGKNHPNDSRLTDKTPSNVLLCTYVYQAVQDRQLRNVDPGFFITDTTTSAIPTSSDYPTRTTTSHQLYDQRRLATMAAIENYDIKSNIK